MMMWCCSSAQLQVLLLLLLSSSFILLSSASASAAVYGSGPFPNPCPDLPSLRSKNITTAPGHPAAFDPAKTKGLWYELAYIDIAQVASRCQTLNFSYEASGVLEAAFRVDYAKAPFTITEVYTPQDPPVPGLYTKTAKMPGASVLTLPTVIVDVGRLEPGEGDYQFMTIFSCIKDIRVRELVFAARIPDPSPSLLQYMESTAKELGLTWDGELKRTNFTNCV